MSNGHDRRDARLRSRPRDGGESAGSRLREQAELQCKLYVVRAVAEAQLLLNALLVSIDGFRTDEQTLADLRGGIALGNESQHVSLALRELVVALAIVVGGILLRE